MRKDKRKNANINDDAERDKIGLAELSVIKKNVCKDIVYCTLVSYFAYLYTSNCKSQRQTDMIRDCLDWFSYNYHTAIFCHNRTSLTKPSFVFQARFITINKRINKFE